MARLESRSRGPVNSRAAGRGLSKPLAAGVGRVPMRAGAPGWSGRSPRPRELVGGASPAGVPAQALFEIGLRNPAAVSARVTALLTRLEAARPGDAEPAPTSSSDGGAPVRKRARLRLAFPGFSREERDALLARESEARRMEAAQERTLTERLASETAEEQAEEARLESPEEARWAESAAQLFGRRRGSRRGRHDSCAPPWIGRWFRPPDVPPELVAEVRVVSSPAISIRRPRTRGGVRAPVRLVAATHHCPVGPRGRTRSGPALGKVNTTDMKHPSTGLFRPS